MLLGLVAPGSAFAQGSSPSFSQLSGDRGCVTQEGPLQSGDDSLEGCAQARGLDAHAVAVSPDNKQVYVASTGGGGNRSNAIVGFAHAGDSGR